MMRMPCVVAMWQAAPLGGAAQRLTRFPTLYYTLPYTCAAGEDIVEASGKMVVLDRMLMKLKARGHRVTLFSQYNRMLDVIEDYLIYRGYKCARRAVPLLVTMTASVIMTLQ